MSKLYKKLVQRNLEFRKYPHNINFKSLFSYSKLLINSQKYDLHRSIDYWYQHI